MRPTERFLQLPPKPARNRTKTGVHWRALRRASSPQLVQYANTLLRDRVLVGSDYPLITLDRWLEEFARGDFRDEVRPLVLKQNAARLPGLAE